MDLTTVIHNNPYHPSVINSILEQYPKLEENQELYSLEKHIYHIIDACAEYNNPQEEMKYHHIAYPHPIPSIFNLAGKMSLCMRLKTPEQYNEYIHLIAQYPVRFHNVSDFKQAWLHIWSLEDNMEMHHEQRFGYQPWQLFFLIGQLGALAQKEIMYQIHIHKQQFNTQQQESEHASFNEQIWLKFLSNILLLQNYAREMAADMLICIILPNWIFSSNFNPQQHPVQQTDPFQFFHIRNQNLSPYFMMKRLLHALQAASSKPPRRKRLHFWIIEALKTHVLFLTGSTASNIEPSSIFQTQTSLFHHYQNKQHDVLDEVSRALEEEIHIVNTLKDINSISITNAQDCLPIFHHIELLIESENFALGHRLMAFMQSQHPRLGQNSIANSLHSELAALITKHIDLSPML